MRRSPVIKITELINNLPSKDIPIAKKFIDTRRFEDLKDLVDSAIIKVDKSKNSDNPKEEYLNIDSLSLLELKAEVDSYLTLLEVPSNEDDFEGYYEDYKEPFIEDLLEL